MREQTKLSTDSEPLKLRKRSVRCILIIAFLFLASAGFLRGPAEAYGGSRVVKVGYFDFRGYHDIDEEGSRSGYGYEYLHEMAKSAGWTFQYVSGTWSECMDMLESGEIDLLTSAQYTEERAEKFDFSDNEMGISYVQLTVKDGNTVYKRDDYEGFNGMRIGQLQGNSRNDLLTDFAEENNFTYASVYFDDQTELEQALHAGSVDALLTSSLRNTENERIIAMFAPSPFYCIVKKGDAQLLKEVNQALSDIDIYNPAFKSNLYNKFYRTKASDQLILSEQETEYLSKKHTLRIAVMPDEYPLSYLENGEYKGIVADVIRDATKNMGVELEFIQSTDYQQAIEQVKSGRADIISIYASDFNRADNNKIRITSPYMELTYSAVTKKEAEDSLGRIAVVEGSIFAGAYLKEQAGKVVSYKNGRDAIRAVSEGKADIAYVNTYSADAVLQRDYSRLKSTIVYDYRTELSIGAGIQTDSILYTILDKAVNDINKDELSKIIAYNTILRPNKVDIVNYARQNIVQFTLILTAIFVFIIGAFVYIILNNKKHSEHMFRLAYVDPMTGLWNSNGFEKEGKERLKKYPDSRFAVAEVDLRKFSMINSNYGREMGDEVIREMAQILKRFCGGKEVLGHVKADQFIMLFQYESERDVADFISTLKSRFTKFNINDLSLKFTPSVGIYLVSQNNMDFGHAVDYTETAHRESKIGKESVIYYDTDLLQRIVREKDIADRVEFALENGEFEVYYQPKYNMKTNQISGAEALIRWNHGEWGFMRPDEFIPILEKAGNITEVDFYVLEEVCRLLHGWLEAGKSWVPVSVNQSRVHFQKPDYIERLQNLLIRYDIPRNMIELEITESLFENENITNDIIKKMKMLGFLVSVDDFGSGYSSLYLLNQVSVDILKIDKTFLYDSESESKVRTIIRKVVEMAGDLGLEVICEGVEKQEQAEFLVNIGCYFAQGFLYAKPMPLKEFREQVEKA